MLSWVVERESLIRFGNILRGVVHSHTISYVTNKNNNKYRKSPRIGLPVSSPQAILGAKVQEKHSRPISLGL